MNELNFDGWKCRCSSLGRIVTKSGKLTDDSKSYLLEVFVSEVYGIKREAYGKALEKGIACESDGLRLLNEVFYPDKFVPKITDKISNEFVIGTPDTIVDGVVSDIKNAYDIFSFRKVIQSELNHIYKWQLNGYAFAANLYKCRLFYVLINMPDYLLAEEEKKLFYTKRKWISFDDPDFIKYCEELRMSHTYDNMNLAERFNFWEWDRSNDDDQRIIDAVIQSRKYLNELLDKEKARIEKNLSVMIVR